MGAVLDRTLLLQAARKAMVTVPAEEIDRQVEEMIAELRAHYGSEAEFRQAIADLNRNTRLLAVSEAVRQSHIAAGLAAQEAKPAPPAPGAGVRHFTPIFAPFRKVPSALARV